MPPSFLFLLQEAHPQGEKYLSVALLEIGSASNNIKKAPVRKAFTFAKDRIAKGLLHFQTDEMESTKTQSLRYFFHHSGEGRRPA